MPRVSPLIEPLEDGRFRVTIAYYDETAADVFVLGGIAGADPADRRLRRDADGWWTRSYELAAGARVGYWLTTALTPDWPNGLIVDPLNPARHTYAADPEIPDEADLTIALVELPGAPERRWSARRDVPAGEVELHRLRSELLGNERRVYTYRPPGYDPAVAYPLVVCFDGWGYVTESYVPLPTVLDNLIADRAIPPVVALLPDSVNNETRARELNLHEPFVEFLTGELLPWAHERLSFADDPAHTLVAGSSLGGLAAAFCGLRRPDVFGLVLSQSGAFQLGLAAEFAAAERLPLRFWLEVGLYETLVFERYPSLYHANVHLRDVLVAKGYDVELLAYPGGHDYFSWRETIAAGLIALLG